MSETQVVEQIYVTTTITKEVEVNPVEEEQTVETEATSAHADTAELSGTTSHSTVDERYDDDHLGDGNSEAVSITSSKLLEEYPPPHYLREKTSTPQMSTRSFNMNPTSEKDLLARFGRCTECNRPNTGEDNWCRSCNSEHFRSQFVGWRSEEH